MVFDKEIISAYLLLHFFPFFTQRQCYKTSSCKVCQGKDREPLLKGRLSTVYLLVLTSLVELLLMLKAFFLLFYKTSFYYIGPQKVLIIQI
jgi:hypothetical protein